MSSTPSGIVSPPSADVPMVSRPRTVEEFLAWVYPEGERWEFIDGEPIQMVPAPDFDHQFSLREIVCAFENLETAADVGELIFAPADVRLPSGDVVQPDVMFLPREALRPGLKVFEGVPLLVVEILSSNRKHDEVTKFNAYQAAGVPEYWIVDPDAVMIAIHRLDSTTGRFAMQARSSDGFTFSPTLRRLVRLLRHDVRYQLDCRASEADVPRPAAETENEAGERHHR